MRSGPVQPSFSLSPAAQDADLPKAVLMSQATTQHGDAQTRAFVIHRRHERSERSPKNSLKSMLYRFVTTVLPVIGILLCPFACMGTGAVAEHGTTISGSPCCGGGIAATHQVNTGPRDGKCPDFPDHDDCRHECVKKARVNTSTRTLLSKLDATFLTDAGLVTDPLSMAFGSAVLGPAIRNATHPNLTSGVAVRVLLASLTV